VQRVQEWVGIHHEDYTFQLGRSRTCEHSASGGTGFGKPTRLNSIFIHCIGVIRGNYTILSKYNWDTAECVHGGYQDT